MIFKAFPTKASGCPKTEPAGEGEQASRTADLPPLPVYLLLVATLTGERGPRRDSLAIVAYRCFNVPLTGRTLYEK